MLPTRSRVLLWSALSGVLWALAWPAIGGFTALAFVAWLPLLHAQRLHTARTEGRRRAFVPYAMLAFLIWNAASSYWFFLVSEPWPTRLVSGLTPMLVNTLLMAVPVWLARAVFRRSGSHWAAIAFVLFWLSLERLQHNWDLQWPWFALGNVFATKPAWVQWYEFSGVLGGTLWVLLVNLLLDRAIQAHRTAAPLRTRRAALAWATVVLWLPLGYSLVRWVQHEERGPAVEVVVVQPSVDPYLEKFGGIDPMEQLEHMLALAEAVMTDSTALVVLPETALQERSNVDLSTDPPTLYGLWENDLSRSRSAQRIRRFQEEHPRVAVLSGMSANLLLPRGTVRRPGMRELRGTDRLYESTNAALFMPTQGPVEHYRKSKLVAGVELMPFEGWLGPLDALAIDLGGTMGTLGRQDERSVLVDATNGLRIVPAICYESVFGEHLAEHVRNNGNLITIMTNDGWWGHSPGHRQHLSFASLRAIELRRAIARSANTGTSCFVDQRGNIRQATAWWVPTAERAQLQLNSELTFFARHGDLLGRVAVWLAMLMLVLVIVRVLRDLRRK